MAYGSDEVKSRVHRAELVAAVGVSRLHSKADSRDPPSVFRVLMFDLDDTLFDRGAAFERWARERLGTLDTETVAWLQELDDRGRRPRRELADGIAARLGVTVDPDGFSLELARFVEPEPGAYDSVKRLAAKRRVAVVSNGHGPAQRAKLVATGLADVVHAVFISGELGFAKPDARIFERALQWSEHAPSECLFIGDDPVNDLAPAMAFGMGTAWRERGTWPAELAAPQFTIHSLADLEAVA
ncbi:MAG: HAD-superfamily hydrolase, subfamily variant 1 [Myxococcales bacterium]|nr:HAD-superfamily hydrolase, subfamily variant 1 [Myxococcales bacterium]